MTSKQDTPIKSNETSSYHTSAENKLPAHMSNDDTVKAMISFKKEILDQKKQFSDSQSIKYNDLKNNVKYVFSLITELKGENSELRVDVEALFGKIVVLEINASSIQPREVVSQVLKKIFEHDRCSTNLIAYVMPKSTSSFIPE